MARKTTAPAIGDRSKRRRAPRQMAVRGSGVAASDGRPAWPDLPGDARNVLVGLLTQLMLEHVRATVATEAGHDC